MAFFNVQSALGAFQTSVGGGDVSQGLPLSAAGKNALAAGLGLTSAPAATPATATTAGWPAPQATPVTRQAFTLADIGAWIKGHTLIVGGVVVAAAFLWWRASK